MLHFQKTIPIKQTFNNLSKFPQFSLIQKIPPKFYATSGQASYEVAKVIKEQIIKKNDKGEIFVLGLATGSTPLSVYRELIKMHKNGELSFKKVVTFNLDEYYPLKNDDHQSYNYYMNHNLFQHLDIPKENINVPNGQVQREKVVEYCEEYQKKIQSYGGIDIQILGIGRTGHIGFNQPPSPINSVTRLVHLHRLTRKDAAGSFGGLQYVPTSAITMGIKTINKAKKIIIMAWSESKADIVLRAIEGQFSTDVPATFLHDHPDSTFYLQKSAGEKLTRFNTPWIIKGDQQDPIVPISPYWVLKQISWLCYKINKPILRLTYQDYQQNNLSQLVMKCAHGSVQDLNLYAYKKINKKITGWPLGKNPEDKITNQSVTFVTFRKKTEFVERVLIFSPHPDDDVISMGGTLKKLWDQGHEVYVAYMTAGSNAVFDHDAKKFVHFMKDFTSEYLCTNTDLNKNPEFMKEYNKVLQDLQQKYETKSEELKTSMFNIAVKKFVRSSQAKISVNVIGIPSKNTFCLDLPFYGAHLKKKPVSEKDYDIVRSLLRLVEPTVIYAAGDLTDPHGTHRMCLQIILKIFQEQQTKVKQDSKYRPLMPSPQRFFLYRGAWQQWPIAMARVIIPMSPKDVELKQSCILKHQSQKDNPMFPGDDKRQFWQRVKIRNRQTADKLKQLGFSDYEACQCFVNYNDLMNYDEI